MTKLFMNLDGSMTFEGRTIVVTEEAQAVKGGTEYEAPAVDADDNKYVVTWELAPWAKTGPVDVSIACQWCLPASVRVA